MTKKKSTSTKPSVASVAPKAPAAPTTIKPPPPPVKAVKPSVPAATSTAKAVKSAPKKAAPAASSPAKTSKPEAPNKSAFIKSLPRNSPASHVVAQAKKAGITITTKYVYAVRGAVKPKGGKPVAPKVNLIASNLPKDGSVEARFVEFAAQVGLARIDALLTQFRSMVKTLKVR